MSEFPAPLLLATFVAVRGGTLADLEQLEAQVYTWPVSTPGPKLWRALDEIIAERISTTNARTLEQHTTAEPDA